jgi:hypothetical protein
MSELLACGYTDMRKGMQDTRLVQDFLSHADIGTPRFKRCCRLAEWLR